MELNIASVRHCDPSKIGTIDVRPHYVSGTPSVCLCPSVAPCHLYSLGAVWADGLRLGITLSILYSLAASIGGALWGMCTKFRV